MVSQTNLRIPVYFVQNQGQLDHENVFYYSKGKGCEVFFTNEGASFVFLGGENGGQSILTEEILNPSPKSTKGFRLDFRFLNGGRTITPLARGELEGKVNDFKGLGPTKWHKNISTYSEVVYQQVWPGIDLVFRGNEGRVKYEFTVQPGANINNIRFTYDGADKLSLDSQGNLCIDTPFGVLIDEQPISFQEHQGEHIHIESAFQLLPRDKSEVSFYLEGGYNKQFPITIDPGLVYSTYLGGTSSEQGFGIAVDEMGNAYVTGETRSVDFPTTPGAFDTTYNGNNDVFVTKLNADGSTLVYSTYLGGTGFDRGLGIAVDEMGNAYVTGLTVSADFPTTPGAFDTTYNGNFDGFVTKLNADGSTLVYSTYLGGTGFDQGSGIAVDEMGNAYVT
ncbi:hypothetical protein GLW04_19460, partial [Halobacillus litoralis]